ncbi:MAG: hypothetical protein ACXQTS_01025 [Candidatus Methanospirareceae archaeon]
MKEDKSEIDKGRWEEIRDRIRKNIYLQALPYALFISSLTFIGLLVGFSFGKKIGEMESFLFSLFFSLVAFFSAVAISYAIVRIKYG